MSLTFRPIPALTGRGGAIPLGLNNRGWAPVTLFLAGTITAALVFACTATHARKERVTGYLTPREGVAQAAVARPGIMTELFVKNGDLVKGGDPLFSVDTSHALAGGGTLDAAVADGLRWQLVLLDEQVVAEKTRMRSEDDRLSARIRGLTNELSSLDIQRQLQMDRVTVTEARLKALGELRSKGYVSEAEYRAREEAWLSQRQNLAAIDQHLTALSANLAQVRIEQGRAPLDSADRLSRLSASQAELRQRLAEADAQRGQLIRASRAGRVTALQAAPGQHLDPATPVLKLVPEGAPLEAVLYVPSRAIGFIKPGQSVRLMYDAFPYQHFGTHGGTVQSISATALLPSEERGIARIDGPSYRAIVRLDKETIQAYGSEITLQADINVTADIALEDRKMLDWLLEPLRRWKVN